MPDVLDPYISAGCEKQPMNRNEQEADHVTSQGNTDKKY